MDSCFTKQYGNKISGKRFSVLHIYYKDSKVNELERV